jgi:hypothetical protein
MLVTCTIAWLWLHEDREDAQIAIFALPLLAQRTGCYFGQQ